MGLLTCPETSADRADERARSDSRRAALDSLSRSPSLSGSRERLPSMVRAAGCMWTSCDAREDRALRLDAIDADNLPATS